MYEVVCLLYPEALATSITLPAEILQAAAQLARTRRRLSPGTRVRLLSRNDHETLRLDSGLELRAQGPMGDLDHCDLLILPAIWRHPRRVLRQAEPLLRILRDVHRRGAIICSVGSSSSLLAEAGLLDGRVATTHWQDFERFERAYPRVQLKRRHLITQSENLYCVGSVNSIADFTVHLVGRWYGESVARTVEAQFSPEARQAFASAAFLQESPDSHHDALVREAQDLMEAEPAARHRLSYIARLVGLSERSLGRRFRQATGRSPMQYLRELRLKEARTLLQHSDLSIAEIGGRCGFSASSRFSVAFREGTGLSPSEYRAAVRGKRFAAASSASGLSRAPIPA
ncbi:MAG: helix-turn-helix domain-containing protein [Pseudomonadota bacterium]